MSAFRPLALLSLVAIAFASVDVARAAPPTSPNTAHAASALDADTAETGRALSKRFLASDTEGLWALFSPEMRAALKDAATLAQFRAQVGAQFGEETGIEREDTQVVDGARVYLRISRWSKFAGPIELQWAFDSEGRVLGFFVRPAQAPAASSYLDRDTRADLRLPFSGDWFVFWGGRTLEQNYHAIDAGQRFAYDFLREVDGRSHRGDGRKLEDYYCWDSPILAPASGRVTEVVVDRPDQAIGSVDTATPAGNHVVLDLGHGEYVVLAHLRAKSVTVRAGDQVARGEMIGRCGNSGNTSEPHLHLHLQDSAAFGRGLGLPAFFNDYMADGKPVTHGEPVRGQTVRAQTH